MQSSIKGRSVQGKGPDDRLRELGPHTVVEARLTQPCAHKFAIFCHSSKPGTTTFDETLHISRSLSFQLLGQPTFRR